MLKKSASQSCSFGLFGLSSLSGFWLNETNQMNQINQINETNQINQITRQTGLVSDRRTIEALACRNSFSADS